MTTQQGPGKFPLTFFVLVFILAVPFWILGALVGTANLPINLPLSALGAFAPMIAALILVYRASGRDGAQRFLSRALDYRRIEHKRWYVPILLLMPVLAILAYVIMSLTGNPVADPQVPILLAPVMFAAFFIGGIGEELGWQGYAFELLYTRWDALRASLVLGALMAVWHSIPFIQTHNSATWIAWQCTVTIGQRILITWLYNNTGRSVFAAVIFHALYNVCTFMFPNYGSHYDPFITSLLTFSVVGLTVYFWGAGTLSRYRYRRSR